jgi:hypothetical protein
MDDDLFEEMVQKKFLPGILIFNQKQQVVYFSDKASNLLSAINDTAAPTQEDPPVIPAEIYRLCNSITYNRPPKQAQRPCRAASIFLGSEQYRIRTVLLFIKQSGKKNTGPSHIMPVIEPSSLGSHIDINNIKVGDYRTKREAQVSREIVRGFPNNEIKGSFFINEHTARAI